jgi:hypothetical protein
MFRWFGTVTNTRGDSLPGWQVECVEVGDGQTVVPIFADENGTPIASVSGVANRAVADNEGNYGFFVPSGTYSLRFYNPAGVFQRLQRFLPMYGADAANTENLASAAGASLVGFQQSGAGAVARTVQAELQRVVTVQQFGALGNNTGDDAIAFRRARDYLVSIGGGSIIVPAGTYRMNSVEAITVETISGVDTRDVVLELPANVSLIGEGAGVCVINRPGGSIFAIIATKDWVNAQISGVTIIGAGSANNVHHGIFNLASSLDHVLDNVRYCDLSIKNVGSYGIGNDLQYRKATLDGIETDGTGSDGIDWKVRGPDGTLDGVIAQHASLNNIVIRNFAKRVQTGDSTGIGWRGQARMNGISVYDIPDFGGAGIEFTSGIANSANNDYRPSGSLSSITNWYCEGADPKADNLGLSVFGCQGVQVGVGTAKWCRVEGIPPTSTPYGFQDGSSFTGVTVIAAHGRDAFRLIANGTQLTGCRTISDKVYFDAKRDNLVAGQTVFTLPFSTTIANSGAAIRAVTKNGTLLTETTDYTWGADSITLTAGVLATDEIAVIFPAVRAFRAEGINCSVVGHKADRFISFLGRASAGAAPSFKEIGNDFEDRVSVSDKSTETLAVLQPTDASAANRSFRLQANGTGTLGLGISANALAFFAQTGATRRTVTGSRGGNAALASLLTALADYGLIINNTTA